MDTLAATSFSLDEEEMELVYVGILDTRAGVTETRSLSTFQQAYPTTLAYDLCDAIINKMDLTPEDAKFYRLILVHTGQSETSSGVQHCVRTLKDHEKVIEVLRSVTEKQRVRNNRLQDGSQSSNRWYFKDIRTYPLELESSGDVSGESSSDEEEEISLSDLAYLRQGERRGFLLKRSSQDPNLWRRRYCVLTDKLWSIDVRSKVPKASSINISGSIQVRESAAIFNLDYPLSIVIENSSSSGSGSGGGISSKGAAFFRATNPTDHQGWIDDLRQRAFLTSENDVIKMAELIMCDEELSKNQRQQRSYQQVFQTTSVSKALNDLHEKTLSSSSIFVPFPTSSSFAFSPSVLLKTPLDERHSTSNSSSRMSSPSLSISTIASTFDSRRTFADTPSSRIPTISSGLVSTFSSPEDEEWLARQPLPRRRVHRTANLSLVRHLHIEELPVSQALAFSSDVQRYKEFFRHDLMVSSRQQWISAMRIYEIHVLPQLRKRGFVNTISGEVVEVDFVLEETSSRALDEENEHEAGGLGGGGRGSGDANVEEDTLEKEDQDDDGGDVDGESSQKRISSANWELPMQTLIKVHQTIFANIRRFSKHDQRSASQGGDGNFNSKKNVAQHRKASIARQRTSKTPIENGSNRLGKGFWPWSRQPVYESSIHQIKEVEADSHSSSSRSSFEFSSSEIRGGVYSGDGQDGDEELFSYRIIDQEVRAPMTLFDGLVEGMCSSLDMQKKKN